MGYSPGACSNSSLRSRSWDRERVMPLMPSASRFIVGCDDRIRACFDRDYPVAHGRVKYIKEKPFVSVEEKLRQKKLKKEIADIKKLLDQAEEATKEVQTQVGETKEK